MNYSYLNSIDDFHRTTLIGGGAQWVEVEGRSGLLARNRTTRAVFDRHTINAPAGTVSFWVLALEDLSTVPWAPSWVDRDHPGHRNYPFLCDSAGPDIGGHARKTKFALSWDNDWYPQFYAKFYAGGIYPESGDEVLGNHAVVGAGHWDIKRRQWYRVSLVWNKPSNDYVLYLNGICAARADNRRPAHHTPADDLLYTGDPAYVISGFNFSDVASSDAEVLAAYRQEGGDSDSALNRDLRRIYLGQGNQRIDRFDLSGWKEITHLSLTKQEHAEQFYIQGAPRAVSVSAEGLRITTPETHEPLGVTPGWSLQAERLRGQCGDALVDGAPAGTGETGEPLRVPRERLAPEGTFAAGEARDLEMIYLWLREWCEGDLHVEYEFMPLKKEGLSLLMLQSAGMHREDFMTDDPPRTNGSMRSVCWENIRNYHWEYYRNILDCRRDVASHVLVKNPRLLPLALGHQQELKVGEWHRLQFHQEDGWLRGLINGEVVIEARDNAFFGQGPIYACGRIAIRCMLRTDIVLRNLRILNRGTRPRVEVDRPDRRGR